MNKTYSLSSEERFFLTKGLSHVFYRTAKEALEFAEGVAITRRAGLRVTDSDCARMDKYAEELKAILDLKEKLSSF